MSLDKKDVMRVLEKVYDPEYPASIVEMGMVDEDSVEVGDGKVKVQFKPTTPFCPMGGLIGVLRRDALEKELNVKAEVRVKPGTHLNEAMVNTMINDEAQYKRVLGQLSDMGMLERCVKVK